MNKNILVHFYLSELYNRGIMYNTDLFEKSLNELKLNISDLQMEQFLKYYEFLVEKNKVMNLTGITDFDEVITKHFVDSLSIVKIYDLQNVGTLIDVGTGAGFPGLPIKIMFPDIKVTLMDSLNKRINFLRETSDMLSLTGMEFIHGRAEDIAREKNHREMYDLCVSRAVANLSTLSEYCLPFVKVGGSFICYKAGNSEKEIENAQKAVKELSGVIKEKADFNLPFSDNSRTLLNIYKEKNISNRFPRKPGIPAKNPL